MSREQRQERYLKFLLWALVVLNMIGILLLRHPEPLRAQVSPTTNYADAASAIPAVRAA